MNWFTRLFHRHQWMTIAKAKGKAVEWSIFGGDLGKTDIVLCVDSCHCGKQRAYMSTHRGDQEVGLNYAKNILDIQ